MDALLSLTRLFQSTLSVRRATSLGVGYARLHPTISIHALRKESDLIIAVFKNFDRLFQSTLSVRRATDNRGFDGNSRLISIHALRKESDVSPFSPFSAAHHFNPRSP